MKLYNKKLRSLADLKHEKQLLMREQQIARKHQKDPFSALLNGNGKKDNAETDGIDWVSMMTKLLAGNSIPFKIALSLATPLLGKIGRKGSSTVKKIAFEVLGGYIKWKAVDMGFRLVKKMLKKKKTQKNDK